MSSNTLVLRGLCGRCGVLAHLHPENGCGRRPRPSWWWERHYAHRHLFLTAWLRLPPKARWWLAVKYQERTGRDWCQIVDSVTQADQWGDYADDYRGEWGCSCDFPAPWDAGPPRYGWCYCTPPEGWTP